MADSVRVERRRVESGDGRINALPDDLLCHILSFLPTESAVRASLVSKRWRYLHTLISSIDISIKPRLSYPKPEKFYQLMNYVERGLLSRRSVQRFRLEIDRSCGLSRVNEWIAAFMCRNIQELELCIKDNYMGSYDVLPASLFSCATLVVLKLVSVVVADNYALKIPAEASLPNLKVLYISQTDILDVELEKLLSRCPVLDDLFLSKVFTDESGAPCKLNISNGTLRRLAIHPLSLFRAVEVVINCPAFEYLSFYIRKNQSLVLLAKQCLAEVVIGSYSWGMPLDYANAHEYDVFKEIYNVQSLHIRDYALWRHYPSIFIAKERNDIKYTLEQSKLVGLLCYLKTIKIQLSRIRDAEAEDLMEMIKFFLNNAKILDELTIRIKDFPYTQQSKMRTEFMTIPRASNKCRVVLNGEKVIEDLKSQYNNMLCHT